jgi:hypothetical protein
LWTVDKGLLAALLLLMIVGLILSPAASPAVAERIGVDSFHFVKRHVFYLIPALVVLIGASFMNAAQVRRAAGLMLVLSLILMLATLFFGYEAKGARRWISIAGFSIQPSEFLKPAFVVVCAWLFAENIKRPEVPGNLFAVILLAMSVALLVAQPDLGQTILIAVAWGAILFLAGISWRWITALGKLDIPDNFKPGIMGESNRPVRRGVCQWHTRRKNKCRTGRKVHTPQISAIYAFACCCFHTAGVVVPSDDLTPTRQQGARSGSARPAKAKQSNLLTAEGGDGDHF